MVKDILLIGYNEIDFDKHIQNISQNKGDAFTLSYNYVYYNGTPRHQNDIYNICMSKNEADAFNSSSNINGAVAYLATYLGKRNVTYDYINSVKKDQEKLINKLKSTEYLVIAITTTLYVEAAPIKEIIQLIKKYNTKAKIVIGGSYIYGVMNFSDDIMKKYMHRKIRADIYVVNIEGEKALLNIVNAIKNETGLDDIDNIMYFKDDQLYQNKVVSENVNLEENPINWNIIKEESPYFITLRTSISCPYKCSFCEYPIRGGKYYNISVESIRQQLNELRALGTVKHVCFGDDSFNVPLERFKEILRMMISEKYEFTWNSLVRCQFIDREALELMIQSKCNGISMGIESASDKILKNMNKQASSEEYYKALKLIKEYRINSFVSFILGYPGETIDTFNESMDFVKTANPDFFRPHIWYASPLAPIMKERDKYGLKGERYAWSHNTMTSEEAMELYNKMFFEVKNSIWVPQYHFDFPGVMHLLARGHNIQQMKNYLSLFNSAVREKLGTGREINNDTIRNMKESLIK